jgi:hopanoid biosynthesis associated protein HpnK
MNRLIINADDFGIHTEVNQAIIDAHQRGILTSTSLLASGPAFEEAVALARQCPKLGIGIHLCLVGSLPTVLSKDEVPTLVDGDGLLPENYVGFIKKVYEGKVDYEQLYRELDAQMQKILATGLTITHIDSHQHMHVLPPVWKIVQTLMKQYHIHRLRIPGEAYSFKMLNAPPVRVMGRNGLTWLSKKALRDVRRLHYTTSDYFWGMVDGGHMDETNLLYILKQLPFGIHEIMMHPGRKTEVLAQSFQWGYHWQDEYGALLSPRIRQVLAEQQIQMINFGDLP